MKCRHGTDLSGPWEEWELTEKRGTASQWRLTPDVLPGLGEKTSKLQSCGGQGRGCPEPLGGPRPTWGFSDRFPLVVGSSDVSEIMEHIL